MKHQDKGRYGCPTCQEPETLLWYAAGRLAEEPSARVRRALSECPFCRSALRDNETLVRIVQTMPSRASLSPEELVALSFERPEDVDVARLADEDKEILEVLRRVNAELESEGRSAAGWFRELWQALAPPPGAGFWEWARSPAMAYLLVLGLAYPAVRGVLGGYASSSAPVVVEAPHSLGGGARGDASSPVRIARDQDHLVLSIFVPVDRRQQYSLRIVDDRGSSRWQATGVQSFDRVGTFVVVLPARFLASGDYELQVEEIGSPGDGELFRFAFRIED